MFVLRSIVAGLVLVGASGAARAQTPGEEAALRQSCAGDYMRLCAMFDPNSPQVEQCFDSKMAQLSPQCRNAITAFSKKNPEGRKR